jgi:hypothetical protein
MMVDDVRSLCVLMHEFGLATLAVGEIRLERPASTIAVPETKKKDDEEEEVPDPIAKLRAMTPDQQDKALRLGPTLR